MNIATQRSWHFWQKFVCAVCSIIHFLTWLFGHPLFASRWQWKKESLLQCLWWIQVVVEKTRAMNKFNKWWFSPARCFARLMFRLLFCWLEDEHENFSCLLHTEAKNADFHPRLAMQKGNIGKDDCQCSHSRPRASSNFHCTVSEILLAEMTLTVTWTVVETRC